MEAHEHDISNIAIFHWKPCGSTFKDGYKQTDKVCRESIGSIHTNENYLLIIVMNTPHTSSSLTKLRIAH